MALKPARLQWSEDGALKSLDFDDIYFQSGQGREESDYVFLRHNRLAERFESCGDAFHIGELGFGSGLNFLLTADLWRKTAKATSRLFYVSIEKHPIEKNDLARIYSAWPELKPFTDDILAQYPPMVEGFHHLHFHDANIRLMLLFGDIGDVLPELQGRFDAWYLDGFAPAKNPAMWEEKLFPLIAARTKAGGTLATFSAAGGVRRGLAAAGFDVKKVDGYGVKRDMTVANKPVAPAQAGAQNAQSVFLPACSGQMDSRLCGNDGRERKITVLGAGLAGCSAARALADKGYQVTVIDRQRTCAQETSGNPVGILYPKLTVTPSPMGLFHRHGFCYSRALLESLQLPSWTPCGVLHLDLDLEEQKHSQELVERNDYPPAFAFTTEDAAQVAGVDLNQSALAQPVAGYLSPPEFCAALLDHKNIKTVYSKDALECDLKSGITIIALGNDTLKIAEAAWLPLQSLRGQVSFMAATAATEKLKAVVCHDGYITPAVDGIHCFGATFQKEPPAAPEVRGEDHAENLSKLKQNIPALGGDLHVTGGRTGYRATTPDKLPAVGPCPDYDAFVKDKGRAAHDLPDLYISTGFGAHGLSGAPLAGEIIACLISGDPLPIPSSLLPYLRPDRFILRALRRKKI